MAEHMSGYKEGDKVQIGVLTGDVILNATVEGFYKEFVVVNFDSDGFYLSMRKPTRDMPVGGNWFVSKMIVHPDNLRHRKGT
jgi:hypothetical protein